MEDMRNVHLMDLVQARVFSCKTPSLPEALPSKHFLKGMAESLGTHHFHKAVKNLG